MKRFFGNDGTDGSVLLRVISGPTFQDQHFHFSMMLYFSRREATATLPRSCKFNMDVEFTGNADLAVCVSSSSEMNFFII